MKAPHLKYLSHLNQTGISFGRTKNPPKTIIRMKAMDTKILATAYRLKREREERFSIGLFNFEY